MSRLRVLMSTHRRKVMPVVAFVYATAYASLIGALVALAVRHDPTGAPMFTLGEISALVGVSTAIGAGLGVAVPSLKEGRGTRFGLGLGLTLAAAGIVWDLGEQAGAPHWIVAADAGLLVIGWYVSGMWVALRTLDPPDRVMPGPITGDLRRVRCEIAAIAQMEGFGRRYVARVRALLVLARIEHDAKGARTRQPGRAARVLGGVSLAYDEVAETSELTLFRERRRARGRNR
jgi:hypothetical protein